MKQNLVAHSSRDASKSKRVYLTKRILFRVVGPAIREASKRAMDKMGYIVHVDNGNVVRVNKDGSQEILEKLPVIERPSKIVLR